MSDAVVVARNKGGRPCRFGKPLRAYVAIYGHAERTIKWWVKRGDEVGEVLPLDDPAGMVAWWERWMKKRVPDEILEAAGKKVEVVKVEAPVEKKAAVVTVEVDGVEIPEGRGVEAELVRLEELAARLSVKAHEPGQARNYTQAVSQMSILTKRLREEAERARKLLPRDAVEAMLHEFHGPIEREVRMMLPAMAAIMHWPVTPTLEEAWHRVCDETFQRMGEEVLR